MRLQWPQSYYSLSDVTAFRLSISPVRYCLFRFGPVFAVTLFVAVSVERMTQSAWVAGLGVALAHGLLTSGRAFAELVGARAKFNRAALMLSHVLVLAGVVFVAVLAIVLRHELDGWVPSLADVRSDLWTALGAAVLGGYLVHLSQRDAPGFGEVLKESRNRVPSSLWALAADEAEKHDADPNLVHAVLLVENLQRPSWLRTLERLKGRVWPEGSYGIMQVESPTPLRDEQSVRHAVATRLAGIWVPRAKWGGPDYEVLREVLRTYNPDARFVELGQEAYSELERSQPS